MRKKKLKRYKRRKGDYWQDDEIDTLKRLAGKCTISELIRALEEECGTIRTHGAVRTKAQMLGLSLVIPGLSETQVARIFGVSTLLVRKWIAAGRLDIIHHDVYFVIEEEAVRRFIRSNPYAFHIEKVAPNYRALAEVCRKADPLLTVPEVMRITGLSLWSVRQRIRRQKIPYRIGYYEKGGKQIMLRPADVHLLRGGRDVESSRAV